MSAAKNELKGQEPKGKKNAMDKEKSKKIKTRIMLSVSIVFLVIICTLIGYEKLHRDLIVKVNDSKLYQDDMMYYIYSCEAQYNYYNQMYMLQMGSKTSYWDMDMGDGKTTRDVAKEDVLNTTIKYQVLHNEAIKAGYKLTASEKKETAKQVTTILGQLSDDQKKINGLSKEQLTKQINYMAVADQYSKDKIDSFDIDDAAIKAGVKYDEYRQYNIEYYKILLKTTDKNGKSVVMSESEQKDAYNKLNALLEKSKTAKDFSKIKSDSDTDITYKTTSFTAQDDFLSDDVKNMLINLKNNEISKIVKVEDAYYLVKMVDNNSSEAYDKAVTKAISSKESEEFDKLYQKLLKGYTVKVNNKVWDKIKMGNITS